MITAKQAQNTKFSPITKFWWIPVLISSIFLNIFLLLKTHPQSSQGSLVIGVIDGDTLVLEGKSKVRLRYADAPELKFCGGIDAKNYLEKLVVGKKVRIDEQIPDQYGRGMALVYRDDTLVNSEMLSSGWAKFHHDNSSVTDQLKAVAAKAKESKQGIFGLCQSKDTPEKAGCLIKGNIDDNSDRKNYYLPNCAQYKFTIVEKDMGEGWFCSEQEAQAAGFTRAATCAK